MVQQKPHSTDRLPRSLVLRMRADPFWTAADQQTAIDATTFVQLLDLAKSIAGRMRQPLVEVCGPIRSGGLGSAEANLERFIDKVADLRSYDYNVFNQMPFEVHFWRIQNLPGMKPMDILEVFYGGLFRSGLIKQLLFMPGWRSSFGCNWEHRLAVQLGLQVVYLA